MARIYSKNKQYNGISAGVNFVNGVGVTDDPYLVSWFMENGYTVEEKKEIKNYENMTYKELTDYAKERGFNGIGYKNEIFDKSVAWSIRNQDGTSTPYASTTASTGNSATVKAASSSAYLNKYVVLKATLSDDSTVFKEFNIQIKSLL